MNYRKISEATMDLAKNSPDELFIAIRKQDKKEILMLSPYTQKRKVYYKDGTEEVLDLWGFPKHYATKEIKKEVIIKKDLFVEELNSSEASNKKQNIF